MNDGAVRPYIAVLTPMRGVAALSIVLFHGVVAFQGTEPFQTRAVLLKAAVTFFFILSGFVLTLSWRDTDSPAAFWRRRAARLLPLYVLVWLVTLVGRSLMHWVPTQTELAASLLLIQSWLPDAWLPMAVNPPAWSLSCEAFFYLCLPLVAGPILRSGPRTLRRASLAVGLWVLTACALTLVWPIEWWVGYRGAEFALGVLLAAHIRSGWRPGRLLVHAGTASWLLIGLILLAGWHVTGPVASLCATPAFLALIAAAAVRHTPMRLLDSRALHALGRWSFALYISHWIIVVMMSRLLEGAVWIPVSMVVSVLVAGALYRTVERPAETWLLDLSSRRGLGLTTPSAVGPASLGSPSRVGEGTQHRR